MLSHFLATPWTVARQSLLSMGLSRQEYWSGLPCPSPGDLRDPGIEHVSVKSLALAGMFFITRATCSLAQHILAVCLSGFLLWLVVARRSRKKVQGREHPGVVGEGAVSRWHPGSGGGCLGIDGWQNCVLMVPAGCLQRRDWDSIPSADVGACRRSFTSVDKIIKMLKRYLPS